jgi:hypothetical protein
MALAAAPAALAQHQHGGGDLLQIAAAPKAQVFLGEDLTAITRLADIIIPRSDTPGAADAGVQFFIDSAAKRSKVLEKRLRGGLDWLKKNSFLKLAEKDQIALVKRATTEQKQFFKTMKDLTIDGYYGSREGLTKELEWNANTFLSEFKGCTHPEHKA